MRRIVLDQGLPATAAILLRGDGWDAVHVREIGMQSATDTEILEYASRESRAVVTLDRDFPELLALLGAAGPSVVFIRQQGLRAADMASLLGSVWRAHAAALDRGSVVKVSARGSRVRLLPLK